MAILSILSGTIYEEKKLFLIHFIFFRLPTLVLVVFVGVICTKLGLTEPAGVFEGVPEVLGLDVISHVPGRFVGHTETYSTSVDSSLCLGHKLLEIFWF